MSKFGQANDQVEMSEELEPVLRIDQVAKGAGGHEVSKFAEEHESRELSEELEPVLSKD